MQRIRSAVRWEGRNLPAVRDFLAELGLAALVETDGTKAHVLIVQGADVLLDIILNDGDGLLWDGRLVGVARNMVFSHEMRQDEETVH